VRRRLLELGAAALVAAGLAFSLSRVAPLGTSYAAKIACSAVFVSGRELAEVEAEDLAHLWYVAVDIDEGERLARAHLVWLARATAVWRPGQGCTLVHQHTPESLRAQALFPERARAPRAYELVDAHDPVLTSSLGVDRVRMERALVDAFSEPDATRPRRTRAVVVLYRGFLVAEGYRVGFHRDMPLLGWSMTKSVLATLVGRAAHLGLLPPLDAPAPLEAWAFDDRRAITWKHLLRMSSGLAFEEAYGPLADAADMLFLSEDAARVAADAPLVHPVGTHFAYSSGTTNILSLLLRRELGDGRYHAFPYRELFDRMGLEHAVLEPDASGTYVGSSFMYATAREWALLGQLYLQDGVWEGERLLPEGWVDFVRTPAPAAPRRGYGAHFWLNLGPDTEPGPRPLPSAPPDAFWMDGFEGQAVVLIPSREAVIVRLGQTPAGGDWDLDRFVGQVLAALPRPPTPARAETRLGRSAAR
jgi:CubicO group peptidase (beta-lactamase class C family)